MRPSRYARAMMYEAGASGTVTLEPGDRIVSIRAESHDAAGAVTIFGGDAIPVDGAAGAGQHQLFEMTWPDDARFEATAAAKTVVFATTVSFFVAFLRVRPVAPV